MEGGEDQFYNQIKKIGVNTKIIAKYFDPEVYQESNDLDYTTAQNYFSILNYDPDSLRNVFVFTLEQ